ncbi:hypothetical protein [Bradyrhizobium sp. Arg816]|uniref:hypothetical protein n=1 Tax=Bradyrhizobium sp. Arg816 TaxID=2998491 RepID=UPI00249DABB2|nr:hypothetical protein [Bradyrhizobium sp. Arg816]MDI3566650.1 hypothetical protein [Bradyrhizobium sp. Arg816]
MHSRTRVLSLGTFAALALYFLIWSVWRAQFPVEIWFSESRNAFHQDAAAAGLPLYPSADQLIVNNYPPLSFFIVGALGRLFGDSLFVGRALSIIGLLTLAVEIALVVRILAGSLPAGAVGGLWFVAIMAHNATSYLGANNLQIVGQANMAAGFVWFLERERSGLSPVPALLVIVLAGFWKHNIIGISATAVLWLLLRDWRTGARPALISALAAGGGLFACGVIFGAAFYTNLLTSQAYSVGHLVSQIGSLQWLAVAAIFWGIWVWFSRGSYASRLTALHSAIGLLSCLMQWLGDGVFGNAAFDLTIALSVGVGCAYAQIRMSPIATLLGANSTRVLPVVLLALRLAASPWKPPHPNGSAATTGGAAGTPPERRYSRVQFLGCPTTGRYCSVINTFVYRRMDARSHWTYPPQTASSAPNRSDFGFQQGRGRRWPHSYRSLGTVGTHAYPSVESLWIALGCACATPRFLVQLVPGGGGIDDRRPV